MSMRHENEEEADTNKRPGTGLRLFHPPLTIQTFIQ